MTNLKKSLPTMMMMTTMRTRSNIEDWTRQAVTDCIILARTFDFIDCTPSNSVGSFSSSFIHFEIFFYIIKTYLPC